MTAFDHRGRAIHAGKATSDLIRRARTAGPYTIASPTSMDASLADRAAGIEMGDYWEPGQGLGEGDVTEIGGVEVPAGFNVEGIPGESDLRFGPSDQSPGPMTTRMADR